MPDRYDTWYRLFRRRKPVAAEVPASIEARRAWVYVVPWGDERFAVHYFEIEKPLVQAAHDTYDYDQYLLNEKKLLVHGEEELDRVLAQWLDDWGQLRDPGLTTYPI